MRGAFISEFGGPEKLQVGDVPMPSVAQDQMLVKVEACGVCGHDLLNRRGYFPHAHLPCVMGHEIAGTVTECGQDVHAFRAGDRVAVTQRISCGKCRACRSGRENLCTAGPGFYGEGLSGGYGDYVLASERNAVRIPDSMPAEIAAVMSCAIGTGLHALRRASLARGDAVVVTGASGGVGLHTLMLARHLDLHVIAITAAVTKRDRLLRAGAAEVIVSDDGRFNKQVRASTGGEGAAAVIEITGAPTFDASLRSVRAGGRLVLVGNVRPGAVALNPAITILKEIDLLSSGHATLADLKEVLALVVSGAITPEIAAKVPRDHAAAAHRLMEERSEAGRVVLMH